MLNDAGLDVTVKNGKFDYTPSDREPKFEYVITKDPSRLARNMDAVKLIKTLKIEKGVNVLFQNINVDTKTDDYEFYLNFFFNFAQQESKDRSKKVSMAYEHRANKGLYHMPVTLYGYDYDKENDSYVINEKEAEVVRAIFDMYINQGAGTKVISNYLNGQGIKTKKGKDWRGATLKRMIKNEKYKGLVILRRKTKADLTYSSKVIERNPNDWTKLNNAIPAIIDEDTWQQAQKIMEERITKTADGSKKGKRMSDNIFYQKIRCPRCNSDFVRVQNSKVVDGERILKFTYYCRNRRLFSKCEMRGISHDVLERELLRLADSGIHEQLISHLDDERRAYNQIMDRLEEKKINSESQIENLKSKIATIDNKIDMLFDAFLENSDNERIKEATQIKIDSLSEEKKSLEKELLDNELPTIDRMIDNINGVMDDIEMLSKKKRFTFEDVLNRLLNISVQENRQFIVNLEIPSLIGNVIDPERFSEKGHSLIRPFKISY